jgi:hypothetical protein
MEEEWNQGWRRSGIKDGGGVESRMEGESNGP